MINNKLKNTIVIGFAIITASFILGKSFQNRNKNLDSISVIGLGTKDFVSDEILWSANFSTKDNNIKVAYNKIIANQKTISDFFINKGFKTNEFSFSAINFRENFREIRTKKSDEETSFEQIFEGYEATQTITFSAKKDLNLMKKIEQVSDKTSELVNYGIELKSNTIQYTYSDLPSLKQNLIEKATKDAYERASKIVKTANGTLGKLKTASMGVFQITGQGSTEEDSYGGNNDILNKNKTARITVRLQYELN